MSLSLSSPSSGSERCRYHGAHSQLSGPDDHHSTDLSSVERHQRALHEEQSSHFLLALRPPGGLPAIAGGNGSLNHLSEHGPNKLCSGKKAPAELIWPFSHWNSQNCMNKPKVTDRSVWPLTFEDSECGNSAVEQQQPGSDWWQGCLIFPLFFHPFCSEYL